MAVQAKAIKQKMKSVGNIRKITRTMEMVSVSKMKRAIDRALSLRLYAEHSVELLKRLGDKSPEKHRFFKHAVAEKKLLILVGSQKGLCGGYNTNLYRFAVEYIREHNANYDVITVGKYGEKLARRLKLQIIASFDSLDLRKGIDESRALAQIALEKFVKSEYSQVDIVYTEFVKAMNYTPKHLTVFPVRTDAYEQTIEEIDRGTHRNEELGSLAEYVLEPSASEIIENVVPSLSHAIIHAALLEAEASEHSSRMFAMKTATDNASELQRVLKISYNRARQASVTQEIAEITAGASAL